MKLSEMAEKTAYWSSGQDAALSRRKPEFDSRIGHKSEFEKGIPKLWNDLGIPFFHKNRERLPRRSLFILSFLLSKGLSKSHALRFSVFIGSIVADHEIMGEDCSGIPAGFLPYPHPLSVAPVIGAKQHDLFS